MPNEVRTCRRGNFRISVTDIPDARAHVLTESYFKIETIPLERTRIFMISSDVFRCGVTIEVQTHDDNRIPSYCRL